MYEVQRLSSETVSVRFVLFLVTLTTLPVVQQNVSTARLVVCCANFYSWQEKPLKPVSKIC